MFRRLTAIVAVAVVACTSLAIAQQDKKPDMEAMMKEWAKYATPGAPHATLAKLAGKWTTAQKMWMDPSAAPTESKGTAEFEMVLGGRFLGQTYKGTFMEQPFEGHGVVGFDNYSKRYMSQWSDNTGTTMIWATGTANAGGNEISLDGTMDDPFTGTKGKKFREVMKIQDADHYVFEWWDDNGGKMVKTMEIVHTRVK